MILIEPLQLCSLDHEVKTSCIQGCINNGEFLNDESSLHRFSKLDKTTSLDYIHSTGSTLRTLHT